MINIIRPAFTVRNNIVYKYLYNVLYKFWMLQLLHPKGAL